MLVLLVFKASYEDLSSATIPQGCDAISGAWALCPLGKTSEFVKPSPICGLLCQAWGSSLDHVFAFSIQYDAFFFLSFFTSLVAEELYSVVFRSFSEKVVLLVCWEEANSRYFYSVILICPQERKHILNIVSKAPGKINIFWVNKNLYTLRKPEGKETRVPQCSSQHCL